MCVCNIKHMQHWLCRRLNARPSIHKETKYLSRRAHDSSCPKYDGHVMEPVLLPGYLGLPCARTCSDPQQKLCSKRATFICRFAGDVELRMGNVVSSRFSIDM